MPLSEAVSPGPATSPYFLRADANPAIGFGHMSRVLALAEALGPGGHLVTAAPTTQTRAHARALGLSVQRLPASHPDPRDLASVIAIAGRGGGDGSWLVVDGYAFDEGYLEAARVPGIRTLRIDDRPAGRVPCTALLDQNPGAERTSPLLTEGGLALLGPRWAILRSEFEQVGAGRSIRPQALRVLVSFGGGGSTEAAAMAIRALRQIKTPFEAVVTVSGSARHRAQVSAMIAGLPARLEPWADMPTVMAWADVGLVGGGVTMLEACASALPAIVLVVADNQKNGVQALDAAGAIRSLADLESASAEALATALSEVMSSAPLRIQMAQRARACVDGAGARRVATVLSALGHPRLEPGSIQVRLATPGDAREVWRIANDHQARANSFSSEAIPWATHEPWYHARLADRTEAILVADVGCVAGHVRIARGGPARCDVHVYVHPAFRGKRLGPLLLNAAANEAARRGWVGEIEGVVFSENGPSRRAFVAAGYDSAGHEIRHGREVVVFRRPVPAATKSA